MDRFWWICWLSFRLYVSIWWVFNILPHLHLLMMSLDCPLAIHHKKGEYLYMLMGRFCVFVDRGSFRLYLGDSWCIVYWLMMYLFLWDIYVRGRNYVFFISFIVSCFTWVIHDICILFFVLWNQKFILFLLVFSTHAFMCLLSITGIYRLIQSCCCLVRLNLFLLGNVFVMGCFVTLSIFVLVCVLSWVAKWGVC